MRMVASAALSIGCLALGVCIGLAAKEKGPGIDLMAGKAPHEAGVAALQQAETLAGSGSWELLGIARVYYLSGDKPKGQLLMDRVAGGKPQPSDWQRIGQIHADAGEREQAEGFFQKALAADPKDDTGQSEIGAWYIRTGQRAKGEELMAKAFARHPGELWHYVRAAEAYLEVPPR
jgi:tetratricopeptide (TPR) repeat protein